MSDTPRPADIAVVVLVAFSFAVAQPVLDVLGRQASFFVVHGVGGLGLVAFALGLTVLVPLAVALAIIGLVHRLPRVGTVTYGVVVGGLLTAFGFQVLRRFLPSGWLAGALAVIVAGAATIALLRVGRVRQIAYAGLVAPPLFLLAFLAWSPASALVLSGGEGTAHDIDLADTPPIVFVIFDEFPTAALLGDDGQIDAALFPHFARLATDATHFVNARTVAEQTVHAVPSILTGRDPQPGTLPILDHHPDNLFTLLHPTYEIRAMEPVTDLCPTAICGAAATATVHLATLLTDVAVVYGHIVLPGRLAARLPTVEDRWTGFAGHADHEDLHVGTFNNRARALLETDLGQQFRQFVAEIAPRERPVVHFLHTMLPHRPWHYLPSGQRYLLEEFLPGTGRTWTEDTWLVTQAYQRHLLQVMFTDRLVGELIDHLTATGMYDDTLIVLTADHGIAFEPGDLLRNTNARTVGGVAAVPLIIKWPGETRGEVVTDPVELVEVLPRIVSALGGAVPWEVGGGDVSATRVFAVDETWQRFPVDAADPRPLARELREPFTVPGSEWWFEVQGEIWPYPLGPYGHWVGPRSRLEAGEPLDVAVHLAHPELYSSLRDPDSAFIPALVRGWLEGPDATPELDLAIAVNGQIATVTRAYDDGDRIAFAGIIPPHFFGDAVLDIEVLALSGDPEMPLLHPLR